ncbi:MAG TPA: acyltransferase [Candidatus Eisenbacteria bacterium]|nr:acyltransferase [Candidatus Eisenbacteria bacterium]
MKPIELADLVLGRLRARRLAWRGAKVAAKVAVGPRLSVVGARGITIGARATLEHDIYLKLVDSAARLSIGEFTFIGRGVEFDVKIGVTVGSHTLIAPGCFVTDHAHGTSARVQMDQQPLEAQPVSIGSDVWLGYGVVVLPGVSIGDGAVVGANSVVTADVPPMAVFAGTPARHLRMREPDV